MSLTGCTSFPSVTDQRPQFKGVLTLILYVLLLGQCENLTPRHSCKFFWVFSNLLTAVSARRPLISITMPYLKKIRIANQPTTKKTKYRQVTEPHTHIVQVYSDGGHMSSVNSPLLAEGCFIHERKAISTHELLYFSTLIYSSHVRRPDNRGKLPGGLRRHRRK